MMPGSGSLTVTWYMYYVPAFWALFREIWYIDRGIFIRDEEAHIT